MAYAILKKMVVVSVLLVTLLVLTGTVTASDFARGSGTKEDPYQIATAEHLFNIHNFRHLEYYYKQVSDINLDIAPHNTGEGWLPFGDEANPFRGLYDGNGYTINNLFVDRKGADNIGLFGATADGTTIRNVRLLNVNVNGNSQVGALVGSNRGIIDNCQAFGIVNGEGGSIGGIVGSNRGAITHTHAGVTIIGRTEGIGGLVGWSNASISYSSATGDVTGRGRLGGLVGNNNWGAIINSHATGNVTSTGTISIYSRGDWIGGLTGVNLGSVSNSYATGNVHGDKKVGGLLGSHFGDILDCHAAGMVSGKDEVGGLVGRATGNVINSYATGDVSGENWVGGLSGVNQDTTVINSYAEGNVIGENRIGGLVGYVFGYHHEISDSYATGNTTGLDQVGGLLGYNKDTVVLRSFAQGDVKGNDQVGGFAGYTLSRKISYSYAQGNVIGSGNAVGGFIGFNAATVRKNYALGDVQGVDNVGGFVGRNGRIIEYAYSVGRVTGENIVGGLVGRNDHQVTSGYYDQETSGQSDVGKGIPRTTAQMKQRSTFPDWDFSETWIIEDGITYPYFSYQVEQNYTLNVGKVGQGTVIPSAGTHTYLKGTAVNLTATPLAGWVFDKWVLNGTVYTEPEIKVTMDTNITATAYFKSDTVDPPDEGIFPSELDNMMIIGGIGVSIDLLFENNELAREKINEALADPDVTLADVLINFNRADQFFWLLTREAPTADGIASIMDKITGYWDADGNWVDW